MLLLLLVLLLSFLILLLLLLFLTVIFNVALDANFHLTVSVLFCLPVLVFVQ